jgi:serine protease
VRLNWTGATTSSVAIFRNGVRIATVSNSGSYTTYSQLRGTFTYRVCNTDTGAACSNDVTVTW